MNRFPLRTKVVTVALGVVIALSSLALFGGITPADAPSASAAQADYFLKLDGIEGESAKDKHKNEIEVLSWSWGMSNPSTVGSGSAGAGRIVAKDLVISKRLDKATPKLFEACASGKHIKNAVLYATRPVTNGRVTEDYVRITLEDVLCTSVDMGGTQSEWATESVSLSYQKIMIETLAKGGRDWQSAGWDLAKNTKI